MRRIDPPRRVYDDNRRRKKSRNHNDDFDLEYEKPPSDWREKVAQRSIGNTKHGAFQVTIRNSKEVRKLCFFLPLYDDKILLG